METIKINVNVFDRRGNESTKEMTIKVHDRSIMIEWDKDTCSICGGNMVTHYVGYVGILDTTSKLANSLGITTPGEYALNIREKKK